MYPSPNKTPKKVTQPSPMRQHQPGRRLAVRSPAVISRGLAALAVLPPLAGPMQQLTRRMQMVAAPDRDSDELKSPYIQMRRIAEVACDSQINAYFTQGVPPLNRVLGSEFEGVAGVPTPLMPGAAYTGEPLAAGDSIPEANSVLLCIKSFLNAKQAESEARKNSIYQNLFELLQGEYDAIQNIEFLNIYELYEYSNVIIGKMVRLLQGTAEQNIPALFLEFIVGLMAFTFDQIRFDERPEICDEWGYFLFFKLSDIKNQPTASMIDKANSDIDFSPLFVGKQTLPELRTFYFIRTFYDVVPHLNSKSQVVKDWTRLPVYGRLGNTQSWAKFPIEEYQRSMPDDEDITKVTTFLTQFVSPTLTEPLACILTQTMLVNCFATFRSLFERVNGGRYTLTNDETGNLIFFEVDPSRQFISVVMTTFIGTYTDLGLSGKGGDRYTFTPAIPWVLSFELRVRGDKFEFEKPYCSMPVDFAFTDDKCLQQAIFKTMKDAIQFKS